MEDYENEERCLEALMNEFLSDEELTELSSESNSESDIDYVSSDSESPVASKRVKEFPNWSEITGNNLKQFQFVDNNFGIKQNVIEVMRGKQPVDFFYMFVDEEVLNLMVEETNRYAIQKLSENNLPKISESTVLKKWKKTTISEMKIFLGLQIWFGLVQMPNLQCYWSNNILYSTDIKQVMSRNRFELLLSTWHFTSNESNNTSERLYKITPLINIVRKNFQKVVTPSSNICVDETSVPFQSPLAFHEYVKNKGHKFVIKLFKLCMEDGYTYDFKIYCEAEKLNTVDSVPTSIVMGLCEKMLDSGRTVYMDNTSIELAHNLLNRQTHLVGTLRKNYKRIPHDIREKTLKKGEIIGGESETGVVVIKWCDKHEVLMLSTKHTNKMTSVTSKNGNERQKPEVIVDYNQSKSFIDLSNQVKAYTTCLRRSMKWYHKTAVEILLCAAVVNAFVVYKRVTNINISITEFREEIAKDLLGISPKVSKAMTAVKRNNLKSNSDQKKHVLKEFSSQKRRRCVSCYKNLIKEHSRKYSQFKAKQTRWQCVQCEKFYCIHCFVIVHNCTL